MRCEHKKILVTGASGFIGSCLCEELLNSGYEVHAIVHKHYAPERKNFIQHKVDLMDKDAVSEFFAQNKFSQMIHLAWFVGKKCQVSVLNLDWLAGSLHLVKTFYENGGKTVLISGTVSEYDYSYGMCYEDQTPLNSLSLYGYSKAALYKVLNKFSEFHDLKLKWARIFNLYGLNGQETRFVPYVITSMLKNEEVKVSHCNQVQNYLYIKDAVNGLIQFLESDVTGAVNIAADNPIRLKDIVEKIKLYTGYKKEVQYGAIAPSFSQNFLSGDNKRLREEVGWQQKFDIDEGLKLTVDLWKKRLSDGEIL